MADWLKELGATASVRLRGYEEPALQATLMAVAAKRVGATVVEETPTGSSDSLGAAERFVQTISALTRTTTLAFEDTCPGQKHRIPKLARRHLFLYRAFSIAYLKYLYV